jgi:hypothetical protein
VDILELKFHYPLRALRDERRADGAFAKNPRSAVQPLVEDGGRPIWSERLPVRSGAGAGVVQFTGESRDDVSAVAVTVEPVEPDGLGGEVLLVSGPRSWSFL